MSFSGWHLGSSNKNLLVNWDFRKPVNQRGQTTYPNNQRNIDMFALYGDGSKTLTVADGYIEIAVNTIGTYTNFTSRFENPLTSGSYILSYAVDNPANINQIVFEGRKISDNSIQYWSNFKIGKSGNIVSCSAEIQDGYRIECATFQVKEIAGTKIKLYAAKLETGRISTLDLDLKNDPDYPTELAKCQRYLQIHGRGLIAMTTPAGVLLSFEHSIMCKTPTPSLLATDIILYVQGKGSLSVTNAKLAGYSNNNSGIRFLNITGTVTNTSNIPSGSYGYYDRDYNIIQLSSEP